MSMLQRGDFVRVKSGHDFRPGQDGMVLDATDPHCLGLIFHFDRNNRDQHSNSVGNEVWGIDELGLTTLERAP